MCNSDQLISLVLQRPIDLDYVDCGIDCVYSILYISIFNISEQSGVNYLATEQLSILQQYFSTHVNRIGPCRLSSLLKLVCYNYAQKFNSVPQLKQIINQLYVKTASEPPALRDARFVAGGASLPIGVDDISLDMPNRFDYLRCYSTEIQILEPFE